MIQLLMTIGLFWNINFATPNVDESERGNLSIKIENVKKVAGKVWVGVYDSESNFLVKERAIVEGFPVNSTGEITVVIPNLKYGDYAIALFHDVNNNGVMDRNFAGIPSEPFAFSKKPKSKFRLPKFDEVKFEFKEPKQTLMTKLRKWF